jgi:hypothetical protein
MKETKALEWLVVNIKVHTRYCNSLARHYWFSISSTSASLVFIVNCLGMTFSGDFMINSDFWSYLYYLQINFVCIRRKEYKDKQNQILTRVQSQLKSDTMENQLGELSHCFLQR